MQLRIGSALAVCLVSAILGCGKTESANTYSGPANPLNKAVEAGDLAAAEKVIGEGADVNALDPGTASTPLHIAAEENQPQMVELLVKNGADVNAKNGRDKTPREEAEDADAKEALDALLRAGAR